MKKLTKIILYSAGALALLGGTFGVAYGASSKVRNWITGQTFGNTTPQNSTDSVSTDASTPADSSGKDGTSSNRGDLSSTPTSSSDIQTDYVPELSLSNTDLIVNAWQSGVNPTGVLTGVVTGEKLNTTDVVWEVDNNTVLTVNPVVTKSGAPATVTCLSFFSGAHIVTARAVSNLAIVKTCNITIDDHVSWCKIKQIELKRDSGSIIHKTEQTSFNESSKAYTYYEDKIYFANSSLYESDYDAQALGDPDSAMTDTHALHIVAAPSAYFCIGFDLTTAMKTHNPPWFAKINRLVQSSYTYPALTTCAPICTKITTSVGYSQGIVYFDMMIPPAFEGGVVMFQIDTKYYAVHFDRYVAPTGITCVDPTVNVA